MVSNLLAMASKLAPTEPGPFVARTGKMERAKVSRATKEMAKADPTDSVLGIQFLVH